jgi:hypothetical protein
MCLDAELGIVVFAHLFDTRCHQSVDIISNHVALGVQLVKRIAKQHKIIK